MSKHTTIKVSKKTLGLLHRLAGNLARKNGKRVTLEQAILHLVQKNKALEEKPTQFISEMENERRSFLTLVEQKFFGAQPEDFKEYDYEDVSE